MYLRILVILLLLNSFSICYSKCRSWENGAPSYCAELNVKRIVRKENEKCFFEAEISSYSPSTPKLTQNNEFEKNIKSKNEHLVEATNDFCDTLKVEQKIRGLIIGKCHDNIGDAFFGLERFFKKLFNMERLYTSFKLTKTEKITHIEDGVVTENIVSCPDFK